MTVAPERTRARGGVRRAPALDGIRGLAVMAVVVYHFFGDVLPGGFLGVDMFFVLSGFLITSLLIRERTTTDRVDLKDFWLRRFRRIVPAAVFVLVVGTAAASLVGGDPAVGLGLQFLGTLLFANNWFQIADSQSYFADSGVQVFAHYWSLSVEEQFYVLWPLLFVGLTALVARFRGSYRTMATVAFGLAAVSFAWMVLNYDATADPTRVYYGTDTHSFGLLIGAGLAFLMTSSSVFADVDSWPRHLGLFRSPKSAGIAGVVGLLGLVGLFLLLEDTSSVTYRGGLLAASVLTAVVIVAAVRGDNSVADAFDNKPMHWLGTRSFSLYLWHWPVVVIVVELLGRTDLRDVPLLSGTVALLISLPLAAWSYRWIETPIRRKGYRQVFRDLTDTTQRRFTTATVPLVLLAVCAVGIVTGPKETQLERDLAAYESEQNEADQAEDLEERNRKMPGGDQITVIGDSVTLSSLQALNETFPGVYVDGETSRHYMAAEWIIDSMEAEGTLDPFVVLGFGTNGASTGAGDTELLERLIESIGEDRVIVMVLPYGDRDWMPEAEREILDAATSHDNVYVANWCAAARDDNSLLRDDYVHPTPDGAYAYAGAIEDALQQWVDGDRSVPQACGL